MTTLTRGAVIITPYDVLGWESSRAARTVLHAVLERPGPDVTLRAAAPRRGVLRLFFTTYAEALEAEEAHAVAGVWTLVDTDEPGWDMSYVVADGDVSTRAATDWGGAWTVEVPYQEVGT